MALGQTPVLKMVPDEVTVPEIVPMIPLDPREDWILRQARQRPVAERAAFLDAASVGDSTVRERLERLLVAPNPPEEVLTDGIDPRSDLYRFGVLLDEPRAGATPFGSSQQI
jgi:hypothetical protein